MEVVVTDAESVAARAADVVITRLASRAVPSRPPVLGLATGSSPLGLYRELATASAAGRVDLTGAYGFALDEYVGLPVGHPESYRSVLLREVCERLGLSADRLHVPDGSGPTVSQLTTAAGEFERQIASAGGVDVQILGIGANGHLGFNEPGSALASRTRVKRLSSQTRTDNARFFPTIDDVPTHCVTQGLGTILESRTLLLVGTGAAKADAIAAALEGPLTASCPGSVLQWHPDVVVVLDGAAAADLRNRDYYAEAAAGLPR